MKIRRFLLLLLLVGCQPPKPAEKSTDVKQDTAEVLPSNDVSIENPSALQEDRKVAGPCIRGVAEAVLKRDTYAGSVFSLNEDNRTGEETFNFANGDRLEIRHWGCEYYVLTFRFETSRFHAEVTDLSYWIDKAATLLFEIQKGLDTPLDVKGGINELRLLAEGNKSYNLGEEMIYDDHDVRDFVSIDRIEKLDETRYAVEISLATGPL